ncbi:hypothetical protein LWI29_007389 [Acer saccharum]|uniref:Putative plant transposon protein domain-containing protein n=1 Tax=Acer saccharum TaxID=4024 RepID=A0AA39VY14_ACESA|nr:hypothetical protein LWI29_007389 [Acer saccharum]
MGKTKQTNPKKGTSKGTRASQGLGPCIQNKDFVARLRAIKDRTVIFERGIQVDSFSDTSIPKMVKDHKWENFVKNPGVANLTVVKEFYASMVPRYFNNGGAVMVRGVQVLVSEDIINNLFGTDQIPQPQAPLGYTPYSGSSEQLAKLLRGNDDGRWGNDHPIKQSDLPKDMALMSLFTCASLKPVSHHSSIATKRAEILACFLVEGSKINIGRIIKAEIGAAGDVDIKGKSETPQKTIPFPCLIMKLCRQEGVAELPNDKMAVGDRTDINQRSWKDSASKTNGRKKQKRALEDTQGDEEQDPNFDLPEETVGREAEGPSDSSVSGQLKWIINALKTSKTVQDKMESTQIRIEQKIDNLALQQYEDRQDQEAEDEDIRADLASMRTQLGLQAYQRRKRRRRPPPPPPPPPPPSSNQLLLGWLYNSMDIKIAAQVTGYKTSHTLWGAIKDLFGVHSRSQEDYYRLQLQQTRKGAMKMDEYLNHEILYRVPCLGWKPSKQANDHLGGTAGCASHI